MAYVSISRATIKAGAGAEFERVAERWLRNQREEVPREELLSRRLVRADDGAEYAVISVWASKEAHERQEDSPAEREALGLIAGYLAAPPPAQFAGEVVIQVA
jgi:heme-degrading monooxygenase HmoA